jgi:inorganic pyrophosphatase
MMTESDTRCTRAGHGSFFLWRPHPWHGLSIGPEPPRLVQAYIEITPYDLVKYEVDKVSGYLRVDRPQRSSSQPPTLYGFIPQTYCGERVGKLSKAAEFGDGDPLDICVISERPIERADIVLTARVVGGLRTIDGGKADDKIIAVLHNDNFWGDVEDITGLPNLLIERLQHYFITYKMLPGKKSHVEVEEAYGRDRAHQVVQAAIEDYENDCASAFRDK